ncbi:MAG TPA: hypothetical protein ENI32_02095 [Candidatus Syntrophoarchaeum butanivorans]|uniref:Uncharacterized protein n=1 Tax=Candidatus Syntropharchaeum butanivorans TaxID=1839936 RepID=A0A7J2RZM2_9EURY|nr:hypothetical protein [Candidatus Syntrophoarchaeum butanivorans]
MIENGVDDMKRIIGTKAPTPGLFNIPTEFIERFRKQITLVRNRVSSWVTLCTIPVLIKRNLKFWTG